MADISFEENNVIKKRSIPCEVCGRDFFKYSCPKCGVKTCCLKCVNIHKKELECDGVRDRTKFLYVKNFTDLDFLSDYKLLEETSRFVYNKQKNSSKRFTSFNKELPIHLQRLKSTARKRGTVLLFLLENFSRHKVNTSRLNYKLGRIFWHIEWIFLNAHPNSVKFNDGSYDESLKMSSILKKYFDPHNEDVEQRESLVYYHSAGFSGCRFLLQAERIKNSGRKFHELDIRLSLTENLAGKCIVEYPIIYVVLKDHSYDFSVVDSDDELCKEEESVGGDKNEYDGIADEKTDVRHRHHHKDNFTTAYAKRVKKQIEIEIAESKKNQPKNFLFADYSSSENEE